MDNVNKWTRETHYENYRRRCRHNLLSFDGWLDWISDAADEAEMTIDEFLETRDNENS